jgi:MerR family gold-responsive transcriptional activator of gol and ges genes
MNIGEASAASGVSAKMIRYYESVALLAPPARRQNRYRDYGEQDVHELRFIARARTLGFPIRDIAALLSLWRDRNRPSRDVRAIAKRHLVQLEDRILDMQDMAGALRRLIGACKGDERPNCPILDRLEGLQGHAGGAAAPAAKPLTERDLKHT